MGTADLTFRLHGVICRLYTGRLPFAQYARRHAAVTGLLDATQESPETASVQTQAQARVRLHWDVKPPTSSESWSKGAVQQLGRRILLRRLPGEVGSRLLQTEVPPLPGLQLEASWSPAGLNLDAYYRPHSPRARLTTRLPAPRDRLFAALLYYLVYFPLIYLLEQSRGQRLLHAGAVNHPDGAWLLAGLPGSGKTTFALSLLADPATCLISDNLLLVDDAAGMQVYTVPEPIHLTQDGRESLPPVVQALLHATRQGSSYGRHVYQLTPIRRLQSAPLRALFCLGIADEPTCRPLSPQAAFQRLQAGDGLARELQAYTQFAATLDLLGSPLQPRRPASLDRLLSNLPCFELWLERGADRLLSQAADVMRQVKQAGVGGKR